MRSTTDASPDDSDSERLCRDALRLLESVNKHLRMDVLQQLFEAGKKYDKNPDAAVASWTNFSTKILEYIATKSSDIKLLEHEKSRRSFRNPALSFQEIL